MERRGGCLGCLYHLIVMAAVVIILLWIAAWIWTGIR